MATKRLKELLEARKSSARENSGTTLSLQEHTNYFLVFFIPFENLLKVNI